MHAATPTNGPQLPSKPFSMDMRSKVEEAFQRQVPDEHGLAAREKFVQMLEALGLESEEAVLLLNECDPLWKSRLPYSDFLDFIFGKPADDKKEEKAATIYPSTEEKTADADTSEAVKGSVGVSNSQREPMEEPSSNGKDVTDQSTSVKDVADQSTSAEAKTFCARATCLKAPSGLSKFCSLDCKMADEAAVDDWDKKPLDGSGTPPDNSDKESVQTILTLPPPGVGEEVKSNMRMCQNCNKMHSEVFIDPTDNYSYCEKCWTIYYGSQPRKLVNVVKGKLWAEDKLLMAWNQHPIPGWGYKPLPTPAVTKTAGDPTNIGEHYFPVYVKLNPGLVGAHARACTQNSDRILEGEMLCNRYRIEKVVGSGHFTRALLAIDEQTGQKVCVKKHNSISVENLTDLLTVGRRLQSEDKDSKFFPKLCDAFYDIDGYTVESLVEGQNCLEVMRENPDHFKQFSNLRVVATEGLQGLVYMARAGVVHCDLKPDNIMWIEPNETRKEPSVILVDFGCSRLDSRLENGRNWALSEGGAGHVGKWAPEMVLRLPITHKADVWGLAVALLELHCGRTTWSGEADTVEVILAQVLGLTNAQCGVPVNLLRQSPLDIRQLYTPHPCFFPVQRFGTFGRGATFQELRPATWGLSCVLGEEETWNEDKAVFAAFSNCALVLDHDKRLSAEEMLKQAFVTGDAEEKKKIVEDWQCSLAKKREEAARKLAEKEAAELAEKEAEAQVPADASSYGTPTNGGVIRRDTI